MVKPSLQRCQWSGNHPLYIDYHDNEWGKANKDPNYLFAMLCLEGAQAGLSWLTILKKRVYYYEVFDQFDPEKVAKYDQNKISALLADPGIIRNRLKIAAFINNAKAWLSVSERENIVDYLWQSVDNLPLINQWQTLQDVPVYTEQALHLSSRLKKDGFKFVGPTIIYAYMQAVGMVNDHLLTCPEHPCHQQ